MVTFLSPERGRAAHLVELAATLAPLDPAGATLEEQTVDA